MIIILIRIKCWNYPRILQVASTDIFLCCYISSFNVSKIITFVTRVQIIFRKRTVRVFSKPSLSIIRFLTRRIDKQSIFHELRFEMMKKKKENYQ